MVNLKINDQELSVAKGTTILEAARKLKIDIPSLCHLKGINEIAACRLCVVEVAGSERLVPACNNYAEEGMEIYTNTAAVRRARRANVALMLSQHDSSCPSCIRSGNCALQKIASNFNIHEETYPKKLKKLTWPMNAPLIRNEQKCVKCMRCIQVCEKVQGLGIWDVSGTGSRTTVDVTGHRHIDSTECTYCGQCILRCPVGALTERNDTDRVMHAVNSPSKVTVVQVAPGISAASPQRVTGAMKALGFDYVLDPNFSGDLTVLETSHELIARLKSGSRDALPLITSSCHGTVRLVKGKYPSLTKNLSTVKSPQQVFGAVVKSYFSEKIGIDPRDVFVTSVMACVAKKRECELETMKDEKGNAEVDAVLTKRELIRLLKSENIVIQRMNELPYDSPLGEGTLSAGILGTAGGIMDAALRSTYYFLTGENPNPDAFSAVRGFGGIKEAKFQIPGYGELRVAVTSGLKSAQKLLDMISKGETDYDIVEIMACPGGCTGGGGQQISDDAEIADERSEVLWDIDKGSPLRFSHDNADAIALYNDFLGGETGKRAGEILHTDHSKWDMNISEI